MGTCGYDFYNNIAKILIPWNLYLIHIIWILTAGEGTMGNCHHEKANVGRSEAEGDVDFRGVTISYDALSYSQW